jgi:hypothetical protein
LSSVGGMRPGNVLWYRMGVPGWFAGEGWALTPETAGMARLMGKGPHLGGITAWVRRRGEASRLLIGGRHLAGPSDPPARLSVSVDGRPVAAWEAQPGFFLHVLDLPVTAFNGTSGLAELVIASTAASGDVVIPTAIEQFDVQSVGTPVWGFAEGWHEAEYNPTLGPWHWTSDRATLRVMGATTPLELTMRVESSLRYFDRPSIVRVRVGSHNLASATIAADQTLKATIAPEALREADGALVIETDQTFVPAERDGVADRRRLGVRVFDIDLRVR